MGASRVHISIRSVCFASKLHCHAIHNPVFEADLTEKRSETLS